MSSGNLRPLPFEKLKLLRPPFIYENPQRWFWASIEGNSYYNLWICRSGHANFRFGETVHEIHPWTVLMIPPNTPFVGWNDQDVLNFRNFGTHWEPVGTQDPVFEPEVMNLREVDTGEALIQSILRISAYNDDFSGQQVEWLVLSLLALIWREMQLPWDSPADEIILQQIGRIRSGEGLFSEVITLAREANMSRVHYTRRFKRAVGLSPNEFLIKQRIERCAILLKSTNLTLEQIADLVGYSDQHYFSRQFNLVMGVSPGAYRKKDHIPAE